jgi:hypothetical protein
MKNATRQEVVSLADRQALPGQTKLGRLAIVGRSRKEALSNAPLFQTRPLLAAVLSRWRGTPRRTREEGDP